MTRLMTALIVLFSFVGCAHTRPPEISKVVQPVGQDILVRVHAVDLKGDPVANANLQVLYHPLFTRTGYDGVAWAHFKTRPSERVLKFRVWHKQYCSIRLDRKIDGDEIHLDVTMKHRLPEHIEH